MIRRIFLLLLLFPLFASAQPLKQRLIRQLGYSSDINIPNSWHLADSAALVYSGSRHSDFDYNNMEYLHLPSAPGGSGFRSLTSQINAMVAPNNIDSAAYALFVQFDSLYYFTRSSITGNMAAQYIDAAHYSGDGKCAGTYYCDDWDTFTRHFVYLHDRLTSEEDTVSNNGATAVPFVRYIQYDAYGNPVLDSGGRTLAFEFDASGRYTSWHWYTGLRYDYTYDASGRVLTMRFSEPDSGIGANQYIDSFSYTPGIRGYTGRRYYELNYPASKTLVLDVSFHINALGQKDTIIANYPGRGYSETAWLEYNSQGNPITKFYEFYSGGVLQRGTKTLYYYEDYLPSLTTPSLSSGIPAFSIFPNPVSDVLYIRGGHVRSVTMYDMLGSVVLKAYPQQLGAGLDIRSLTPGSYIVEVEGEAGAVRQAIIKR